MAKRQARAEVTGKTPGGKPLKPPEAGPRAEEQIKLTDEDSRIMKVAGGGLEQCDNAQAVVDTESMRVLAPHLTQAANDKEQVVPMVAKVQAHPEELTRPATWPADAGHYSEKNVAAGIEPLFAVKRDEYVPGWRERFSEPEALLDDAPWRSKPWSPTQNPCRAYHLCPTQTDGRAGVRYHQIGDGIPSMSCCAVWKRSATNGPWSISRRI